MKTTPTMVPDEAASPHGTPDEVVERPRALFRGRALIGLGIGLLVVFGLLAAAVLLLDPLTLDVPITQEIQELPVGPLGALLIAVSAPGFTPWNFIFPTITVLALIVLRHRTEAAFLALASVAASSSELVKALVRRPRPAINLVHVIDNLQSFGFPSGHVTLYTLFFGFCFYLAFTLLKPGWARTLILIGTAAMVLLVGISRVWMGEHWASDVLGGYALGFGLLLIVVWAYRGWLKRHPRSATALQAEDQHAIMTTTAQK